MTRYTRALATGLGSLVLSIGIVGLQDSLNQKQVLYDKMVDRYDRVSYEDIDNIRTGFLSIPNNFIDPLMVGFGGGLIAYGLIGYRKEEETDTDSNSKSLDSKPKAP